MLQKINSVETIDLCVLHTILEGNGIIGGAK